MKFGTAILCHVTKKKLKKKKIKNGSYTDDDVTNYVNICAKLCKKLLKWEFSKIKIIELKWAKHFPETLKMSLVYTVTA